MDIARDMYTGFLIFIEGLQAQGTTILEVLEAIRYVSTLMACVRNKTKM